MNIRRVLELSSIVVLVGGLAACSGGSVGNGGDTTCEDYLAMSASDQKAVIKDFFAEKGESDPNGGTVLLSQQSAKLYCNTMGSGSDPIRNIDG